MYRDPMGGARWFIALVGSMLAVFLGSYAVGYYGDYLLIALIPASAGVVSWWIVRRNRRTKQ